MSEQTLRWVLVGVAVLTGMFIPLQPGINSEMARHTESSFAAGLISFAGGTLILLAIVVGVRLGTAGPHAGWGEVVRSAPWWAYLGGLVGAVFVTVALVLAPRLGAALLVAGIVTGQMIGSLVIDRFGMVGFPRVPLTWPRVVGAALLVAGVVVMQMSSGRGASE